MNRQKDFGPRRIFWTTMTLWSLAIMFVLALISGAAFGLVRAVQSLPWHG